MLARRTLHGANKRDQHGTTINITTAMLRESGITFVLGKQQFCDAMHELVPLILQPADLQIMLLKAARQLKAVLRSAVAVAAGKAGGWPLNSGAVEGSSGGSKAQLGCAVAWQVLRLQEGSPSRAVLQTATALGGGIVDSAHSQASAFLHARVRIQRLGIQVPSGVPEAQAKCRVRRLGGGEQAERLVAATLKFGAGFRDGGFTADSMGGGAWRITRGVGTPQGMPTAEEREAAAAEWLHLKDQQYVQQQQSGFAALVDSALQEGASAVSLVIAFRRMFEKRHGRKVQ